MKILHVDSGRGWRGGQRQVYLLCKGLITKGVNQIALVSSKKLFNLLKELKIPVKLWEYRFELSPSCFHFFNIISKDNPDIIHFHDSKPIPLGLFTNRITVATRRVDFNLKNKFSVFKYKKLDKIIAISNEIKNVLQKHQLKGIDLIHSGIDPDSLVSTISNDECRNNFKFLKGPAFINIASLEDHKGQIYLLQALNILKKQNICPQVHIAGNGSLLNKLTEYKKNHLLDNVHFHKYVENIPALLKAADFFIMTSTMEGLGTSLMDAMYCGLPIIITNSGGMPEVVSDCALIAENKNPNSIAEKIQMLLSDKNLQKDLTHRAKKRVNDHFLFSDMVDKYYLLYQSL